MIIPPWNRKLFPTLTPPEKKHENENEGNYSSGIEPNINQFFN